MKFEKNCLKLNKIQKKTKKKRLKPRILKAGTSFGFLGHAFEKLGHGSNFVRFSQLLNTKLENSAKTSLETIKKLKLWWWPSF